MVKLASASKVTQFLFHPFEKSDLPKSTQVLSKCVHVFLTVVTIGLWQIPFWIVNRLDNRKIKENPDDVTTKKSSRAAGRALRGQGLTPDKETAILISTPADSTGLAPSEKTPSIGEKDGSALPKSTSKFAKELKGSPGEKSPEGIADKELKTNHIPSRREALNSFPNIVDATWNALFEAVRKEEEEVKQNPELAKMNVKDFEKEMGMTREEFVMEAAQKKREQEVDVQAKQIVDHVNSKKAEFQKKWDEMQTQQAEEKKQREERWNQFGKEWGIAVKQNGVAIENLKKSEADFKKDMGMSLKEFVAKADQGMIPKNDEENLDEIKKSALEPCKQMFESYSSTIDKLKKHLDELKLKVDDSELNIKIRLEQAQKFIEFAETTFKEMKSMEEKIQLAENKPAFSMYVDRFEKIKKQTEDNIVMIQSLLK